MTNYMEDIKNTKYHYNQINAVMRKRKFIALKRIYFYEIPRNFIRA